MVLYYLCENSRNDKIRNMGKNPFKFGTIVSDPYFTDRVAEKERVLSVISSSNHLIVMSPRRYGKTSLIFKVLEQTKRPVIALDLQLVTSVEDFAAQLLKRVYRIYPFEKLRLLVRNFRLIPTISLNPVSNQVDISFQPSAAPLPMLEDVLNLIESLSTEKSKVVIVFDEFQEAEKLKPHMMPQLRSVMQQHTMINYIMMGSQESMMQEIFEKKKSPFYHFGNLLPLGKIPRKEFRDYLEAGFSVFDPLPEGFCDRILDFTASHPYYTQQLAFIAWDFLNRNLPKDEVIQYAIQDIARVHDMDYERLWSGFNRTDRKLLIGLSVSGLMPTSEAFYRTYDLGAPSTVFSSLKRLSRDGFVTRAGRNYEIEDPFFCYWIRERRER